MEYNPQTPTNSAPMSDNSAPVTPAQTNTNTHNPRMGSFLERFLALLVDVIILSIIGAVLSSAFGGFGSSYNFNVYMDAMSGKEVPTSMAAMNPAIGFLQLLNFILQLAIGLGYYGWFYVNKGQTPGKMLMKLKVVKADTLKYLNWQEVLIRDVLMKMVSGGVFLIGYFWYFASAKRQTWHDIVVGSNVVKTDQSGNLLMDGPATYPESKTKAILFPCGCCLLLFAIPFAAALAFGLMVANNPDVKEGLEQMKDIQMKMDEEGKMEYNYEFEDENGQKQQMEMKFDNTGENPQMEFEVDGQKYKFNMEETDSNDSYMNNQENMDQDLMQN